MPNDKDRFIFRIKVAMIWFSLCHWFKEIIDILTHSVLSFSFWKWEHQQLGTDNCLAWVPLKEDLSTPTPASCLCNKQVSFMVAFPNIWRSPCSSKYLFWAMTPTGVSHGDGIFCPGSYNMKAQTKQNKTKHPPKWQELRWLALTSQH